MSIPLVNIIVHFLSISTSCFGDTRNFSSALIEIILGFQVLNGIKFLVVPALITLQARADSKSKIIVNTTKEVQNDWNSVDMTNANPGASYIISEVIPMVLLKPSSIKNLARPLKHREHMDQNADLNLSNRYAYILENLLKNNEIVGEETESGTKRKNEETRNGTPRVIVAKRRYGRNN